MPADGKAASEAPAPRGDGSASGPEGGGAPASPTRPVSPAKPEASGRAAEVHPSPQALPAAAISREILSYGSKGSWPLTSGSRVLEVSRRFSAAGSPEYFAVFATVERKSDAEVSALSDFSRLFSMNINPVQFSLVQFVDHEGRLQRLHGYALGEHLVFESLKIVPIKQGADLPFAVSVVFQTQEGSNDQWVTFSKEGTSQITLRQTLSRSPMVEDIDNDGYLDIIIRERGVEEGTGYETFLTWYKWDGRGFKQYKTTNIVRNLREFLRRAATLLSSAQISEFFTAALPAAALGKLRKKGASDRVIFSDVFHLVPPSPDNPNDPIADLRSISRVIFPHIFENPFTEHDQRGYIFPLTVRMVTSDTISHFYNAKIYMNRNPFVKPQFTFALKSPSTVAQLHAIGSR